MLKPKPAVGPIKNVPPLNFSLVSSGIVLFILPKRSGIWTANNGFFSVPMP